MKVLLLLFLGIVVLENGYSLSLYRTGGMHSHEETKKVNNVEWDHFMLVTEWPQSSCEEQNATHGHPCVIPPEVTGWILHGLWPSNYNGSDPQYCKHWHFHWDQIEDLNDELLANWPNLYADTSKTSFWKHEYEKHGTCASSVQGFETEHDFFQMTLQLKEKYDPIRVLSDSNIIPGEDPYEASSIKSALSDGYNVDVCVECQNVRGVGTVLMGAYICMDKALNLVDCHYCEHECKDDAKVLYHPLLK